MIRIEIGTMPSLLSSIVRAALESQGDFSIVDASANDLSGAAGAVDVLIVSREHERLGPVPVVELVEENSPRVIAISADGHSASILHVSAQTSRIDAAADLLNVVRRAALERRRAIN